MVVALTANLALAHALALALTLTLTRPLRSYVPVDFINDPLGYSLESRVHVQSGLG